LYDHIPALIVTFSRQLANPAADNSQWTSALVHKSAAAHGLQRWQQGYDLREVTLGANVDNLRVVTAGLKSGERIVVNGLQRIRPGALVVPQVVRMDARSELQAHLTHRLAQNLRDPIVRARAFVRLSIQGAVARPGYYAVPAEAPLSDALMAAGGTTTEADMRHLRVERAGEPIWQDATLQQVIAEGRTLDEAGLVAGDQLVVPRRGGGNVMHVLQVGAFLLGIPVTIYTLTRIFTH